MEAATKNSITKSSPLATAKSKIVVFTIVSLVELFCSDTPLVEELQEEILA